MKKEWAVYDSSYHEMKFCESIEEAKKHFESVKEIIFEEPVEGSEEVFLMQVVKIAHLVKDEERKDDPTKHGFDFWVKWQDKIINDQQEIERLKDDNERLLNLKATLEEANQGMAAKVEEQQKEIERYRNALADVCCELDKQSGPIDRPTSINFNGVLKVYKLAREALGNKR